MEILMSTRRLQVGSILILLTAAVARAAEPVAFETALAKKAQLARDAAVAKAEDDYRRALIAADQQYLASLKEALDSAMKSKNLPESNRIDAAIKKADTDLAQRRKAARAAVADAFTGTWRISKANGADAFDVTLAPDHSVVAKTNASRGTWQVVDQKLTFSWTNGWTDTFDLAAPADEGLTGKNNEGTALKLVRVPAEK
jgi:hypothetical protein